MVGRRRVAIVILLFVTLVLGGVAVYLGVRLSQQGDTSVASGCSGGALAGKTCGGVTFATWDTSVCEGRAESNCRALAPCCAWEGDTGGGAICDGNSGICSGFPVGTGCATGIGGGTMGTDGTCNNVGGTTCSCQQSGGGTGPVCGNGTCESGEDQNNCAADCGGGGTGGCRITYSGNSFSLSVECDGRGTISTYNGPSCPTTQTRVSQSTAVGGATYAPSAPDGECQQVDHDFGDDTGVGPGGVCECNEANVCNGACDADNDCPSGTICSSGLCRNPSCLSETDCTCSTQSACNGACTSDSGCSTGLVCSSGACRNPSCLSEADCACEPGATNITVSGSVVCQDGAGSTSYPVPGSIIGIVNGSAVVQQITTDSSGAFTATIDKSLIASNIMAVRLIQRASGSLSNGQLISSLVGPVSTYCSTQTQVSCTDSRFVCTGTGYEWCGLGTATSFSNFRFVYTGCTPGTIVCGSACASTAECPTGNFCDAVTKTCKINACAGRTDCLDNGCSLPLPATAIFDDDRANAVFYGLMLILLGILVFKYKIGANAVDTGLKYMFALTSEKAREELRQKKVGNSRKTFEKRF